LKSRKKQEKWCSNKNWINELRWKRERIGKAEVIHRVLNKKDMLETLNKIKEAKIGLFISRADC
jgi:hypothetical protein